MNLKAIDPGNPPAPGHAHDFMSYGDAPWWISPYTYGHLYDKLRSLLPSSVVMAETGRVGQGREVPLWVSGIILPGEHLEIPAVFFPSYRLSAQDVAEPGGEGSYLLQLLDAGGQPLFTHAIEAEFLQGDPPDPEYGLPARFSEIVPFPDDLARIVLKSGNRILAEQMRTANSPVVNVLTPVVDEHWASGGTYWITWEAGDLDGDALYFLIQYSADDGRTWTTLAADRQESALAVDSTQLAGSARAIIRIVASDGVNSTTDVSAPFVVEAKPPIPWIMAPDPGEGGHLIIAKGELLVLEGNATHPDLSPVEDQAFHWFSDRDGELGSGRRLDITGLSPGSHQITLEVADEIGLRGTDLIAVEVVEGTNHQPVADAGADRQVSAGAVLALDGTASTDADGDVLDFAWVVVRRPDGAQATLGDPATAQPNFTADRVGTYTVELVVSDGQVASQPDRVVIEVTASGGASIFLPVVLRN